MKRFTIIILLSIAFAGFLPFLACDKHVVDTPFPPPTFTPTNTATPTFTPVLVSVSLSSPSPGVGAYSPSAVTLLATTTLGQTGVVFTNTDPPSSYIYHSVYASDTNAACATNATLAPGASTTLIFQPTPGTIYIHCLFHNGNCGTSPCNATCEGPGQMAMEVIIQ